MPAGWSAAAMVLFTLPSILKVPCSRSAITPVEEPYLEPCKLEPWLIVAFPKLYFQALSIREDLYQLEGTAVGSCHEILHVRFCMWGPAVAGSTSEGLATWWPPLFSIFNVV